MNLKGRKMTEEEIKNFVVSCLQKEMSLNDIHKALQTECDVRMTFMELRLLSADIDFDWQQLEPEPEPEPEIDDSEALARQAMNAEMAGGQTIVEISKITTPGAAVNGSVIFPSGLRGEWTLDHEGRLGMNMSNPDDRPTEEEMLDFQSELRNQLGG
jgi:hypothetical protein